MTYLKDTIIEKVLIFLVDNNNDLVLLSIYNPSVVILDEATNALDVLTENEVFNSILNYEKNITIIMITHRLEVIKKFDKIIFNNGLQEGFGVMSIYLSLDSFNKLVFLIIKLMSKIVFLPLSHKNFISSNSFCNLIKKFIKK